MNPTHEATLATPDQRIVDAMHALALTYRYQDFMFQLGFQDPRSPESLCCYIRSETYEFGDIELREIYIPLLETRELASEELLTLLSFNARSGCGAWCIISEKPHRPPSFGYTLRVPAKAEANLLMCILQDALESVSVVKEGICREEKVALN